MASTLASQSKRPDSPSQATSWDADLYTDLSTADSVGLYVCPICLGVPKHPVPVCTNSHMLCTACYFQQSAQFACCPLCKGIMQHKELDRFQSHLHGYLQLRCPWGCPAITTNATVEQHMELCPNKTLRCEFEGCSFYGPRSVMEEHGRTCLKRYRRRIPAPKPTVPVQLSPQSNQTPDAVMQAKNSDWERHPVWGSAPNDWTVTLRTTGQRSAMMILDFYPGELFDRLSAVERFPEATARFYAAEIALALSYIHEQGIATAELTPENIGVDTAGHAVVTRVGKQPQRVMLSCPCGTPEYLAPEALKGLTVKPVADWWTLGVILYEMLEGLPPFYSENVTEMYEMILRNSPKFPSSHFSPAASDLLQKLLHKDPECRLGCNSGFAELRSHPFFADIDWDALRRREMQPPV
eukprot:NODE_392_length_1555_cov_111.017507_g360_i0.p1 GENE.NODE_392_length_1555_cov_111.017507_g360_i0~~NODE_392_length_1555_cov_111.017507_g360_i0.p1  ORF type:complete len:410 (-),score=42.36 NODE_392_length_1555_cov_111.017507_g360_i0:44-1273(-)